MRDKRRGDRGVWRGAGWEARGKGKEGRRRKRDLRDVGFISGMGGRVGKGEEGERGRGQSSKNYGFR